MGECETCPGCGEGFLYADLHVPQYVRAVKGCWLALGGLLDQVEADDPMHLIQRLIVDTYMAQHAGTRSLQSARSLRFHLISLYLHLEKGVEIPRVKELMAELLLQKEEFLWVEPPSMAGSLSLKDILNAHSFDERVERVYAWSRSVWRVCEKSHKDICSHEFNWPIIHSLDSI